MDKEQLVWMNGTLVPAEKATVPLLSHGFSRASAIFEIFGIHPSIDGLCAFRLDEHLNRFEQSARLLGMTIGYSREEIAAAVAEAVKANLNGRGLVKMFAYWSQEAVIELVLHSKLDLAIFTIPESPDMGLDRTEPIAVCISKWRKIHPETVPVSAKACANYLNGYLVRKDALDKGFDLGLMVGTDGFLAEGSAESVFIVKDGVMKTPPLGRVLDSISRKSVLETARATGLPTSEAPILANELRIADEIFTANTGAKVLPIKRFEDRRLTAPGPISKQLMVLMQNIMQGNEERFRHWLQPLT